MKEITTNCDKDNIKPLKETLSNFIAVAGVYKDSAEVIDVDFVKEKVQNAQRRIKEFIDNYGTSAITFEDIDKIFLKEFGKELMEEER